jgi:HSP20 family protein
MYETLDAVVLVLELAGMSKEEIELSVRDRTVWISGYRRRPAPRVRKQYHRLEILTGRFEMELELPSGFDATRVRASYQDGLLRVVLPRAAAPPPKGATITLEWA